MGIPLFARTAARSPIFLVSLFAFALAGCATHTVSVSVNSSLGNHAGNGGIQSTYVGSPGPINCSLQPTLNVPIQCAANFPEGTAVVLFPSANSKGLFTGWSGPDCAAAAANPCTVSIVATQPAVINVGANFRQPTITLTVVRGFLPSRVEVWCESNVIATVQDSGTVTVPLPNTCNPAQGSIVVKAFPYPGPNKWTDRFCAGTPGGTCNFNFTLTDDVSFGVDYTK
jgi:hypothetical protein